MRMLHRSEILAKSNEEIQPFYNAEAEVKFELFTRSNPTTPQTFKFSNIDEIVNSNFNRDHPTRFTIHGWNGDLQSNVNLGVIQQNLEHGDYNMIAVDWSAGAGTLDYIAARDRVRETGTLLAQLIDRMVIAGLIDLKRLTLIGHSLGGHLIGMAAKKVSTGRVNTIIALDPASPLFSLNDPTERVDASDAEYVEIIHTNGALLGFMSPIGDADFYPNGGEWQNGCGFDLTGSCAHGRSHEYYAESISKDASFWAVHCTSFGSVGSSGCNLSGGESHRLGGEDAISKNSRGIYYLSTGSSYPYAQG